MYFALDIGTRTVVGLLAEPEKERIKIIDFVMKEHRERAMLDGQIHDVKEVAEVVSEIKKELEERSGQKLEKVSVALAGRFLKTVIGYHQMDVSSYKRIDANIISNLEMNAVKHAVEEMRQYSEDLDLYCVGYSVLHYFLDGEWMKNLLDQRGRKAEVKVIAAFLPSHVVDAMFAVVESVGLEIEHMTLEPIAAVELTVPDDLRRLNLVLIDIGAGTSDIAVSREGTIIAYGMVPKAGDEISEKISSDFLLDFQTAEFVKRNLDKKNEFVVKDILGNELKISKEEVLNSIAPTLDDIISSIVKQVMELNGKPPAAVLIVGGGAKVPGFVEKLSQKLGLPNNRVALKKVEDLHTIIDETKSLRGSEFITPVGIAYTRSKGIARIFTKVTVNGENVYLIGLDPSMTVLQALLQVGYRIEDLIGKPGPGITFSVNDELVVKKGSLGKEASILVNGKKASLRTTLNNGDVIEVGKPQSGDPPVVRLKDIIQPIKLTIDGTSREFFPTVYVNGKPEDLEYIIKDNDKIVYEKSVKVSEVAKQYCDEPLTLTINGEIREFSPYEVKVYLDGKELESNILLADGLSIHIEKIQKTLRDIIRELNMQWNSEEIKVVVNGKEISIPVVEYEVLVNGKKANLDSVLSEGSMIDIKAIKIQPKVIDIFRFLDLEIDGLKDYTIKVNGNHVGFMDPLKPGDEIILELR
ncbi:MAG: cell division protein FtsA [Thermotogae bacterium]|nr:cell division protein FtsA [Thermotogota bacterium]